MEKETFDAWIRIRYRILYNELGKQEFTRKDVENVLRKHDKQLANTNELLNRLSKQGVLESNRKEGKTFYKLKESNIKNKTTNKNDLVKTLKYGADLIRTRVDYKILLILLFYKALSDKWEKKAEGFIEEGNDKEDAYHLTNIDYYTLYDENKGVLYTWDEITSDKLNLINNFMDMLNKVSEFNEELYDLRILIDNLGLTTFLSDDDSYHIFLDLVSLFSKLDFKDAKYDIIGSGYEWILSYFAPQQAKQGENFTPREVIKLIIRVLDIDKNSDVLDPASGSGAMLIEAYNYVSERYKDGKTLKLEGQEQNNVTAILGKLNMLIHGTENYKIYKGDSLTNPQFSLSDYVIANPPWNQSGYGEDRISREDLKNIYSYGLVNKQSADWFWVQLMSCFTKKKVGIVLDNGALFRSGKEKNIRKGMIDDDQIEAIVLLPEKLFYNTGAPGIVMILNKNKPGERKNKILFINASKEYESHPDVRKLNRLSDGNIKNITKAYNNFENKEGFSKVVSKEKIEENDYNLNVTLYVFPQEEMEDIDVKKEWNELREVEKTKAKVDKKIEGFLRSLL